MYTGYLLETRIMCESIWAKFDVHSIIISIIFLIYVLFINMSCFVLLSNNNDSTLSKIIKFFFFSSFLLLVVLLYCTWFAVEYSVLIISSFTAAVICASLIASKRMSSSSIPYLNGNVSHTVFYVVLCLLHVAGYFSNSFVVFEDTVANYLLCTVIMWKGWNILKKRINMERQLDAQVAITSGLKGKRAKKQSMLSMLSFPVAIVMLAIVCILIALRLSTYFRICREEQWHCEPSWLSLKLSMIPDDLRYEKIIRCVSSFGSVAAVLYFTYYWMKSYGNMNGDSFRTISITYILPVIAVCLLLQWLIQLLPQRALSKLSPNHLVIFARICYLWCVGTIAILLFKPLCLYVLKEEKQQKELHLPDDMDFASNKALMVPQIYQHLKKQWQQKREAEKQIFEGNQTENPPPVVFGLATVFSSSLMILFLAIFILLCLLLGDSAALALSLQAIGMFLFLELSVAEPSVHMHTTKPSRPNGMC